MMWCAQVWDTAGGAASLERLGPGFWRRAAAFLYVFNVSDAASFAALDQLRSLFQDQVLAVVHEVLYHLQASADGNGHVKNVFDKSARPKGACSRLPGLTGQPASRKGGDVTHGA